MRPFDDRLRRSGETGRASRLPGILRAWIAAGISASLGCASAPPGGDGEGGWRTLLGEGRMDGWETTPFESAPPPRLEPGRLVLPSGGPMAGIRWTDDFPRMDYEIRLEAMRLEGNDFFCGLTFPVRDGHASLIIGGWGGGVCGISSIDGMDASENETASYRELESGRWYRIRLRVAGDVIQAWLDDEAIVDVDTAGRRVTTRPDIASSKPLGLATWRTTAAIRGMEWRPLGV